jgi:subtilase family serine protease
MVRNLTACFPGHPFIYSKVNFFWDIEDIPAVIAAKMVVVDGIAVETGFSPGLLDGHHHSITAHSL